MKTETTLKLEELLADSFNQNTDFYAFECTYGWNGKERADCVMYDMSRQVYCYEIKQSVSDFHSSAKLSFFGNKNYFVMPYDLYTKVKAEIPDYVGVYVPIVKVEFELSTGHATVIYDGDWKELRNIKPAKKVDLHADKEIILSSILRSRQHNDCDHKGMKYAHWIPVVEEVNKDINFLGVVQCSNCGNKINVEEEDVFCPHCGALIHYD